MTEIDRALVRRKLSAILRNLEDLAQIADLSLVEYTRDRFRQKGTERLLQETIESAVDVNLRLARALGLPMPPDYFASFIALGPGGLLPANLAEALAPSTGLRDRLVHEYDTIDDATVLTAVAEARRLFTEYVRAIEAVLSQDEKRSTPSD